jgi:hypothetical protein
MSGVLLTTEFNMREFNFKNVSGLAGDSRIVPNTCARQQGLGLSILLAAATCRPSPKIRASRPCLVARAEVGKEAG